MFQKAQLLLWRWMPSRFQFCVVIFTVLLKLGESHLPLFSSNHNRSHGASLHPFFSTYQRWSLEAKGRILPGYAHWLMISQSCIISQWEHSVTVRSTSYFFTSNLKAGKDKGQKIKGKLNKTKQRHRPLLAISKKYTIKALPFCLSFSESTETFFLIYSVYSTNTWNALNIQRKKALQSL